VSLRRRKLARAIVTWDNLPIRVSAGICGNMARYGVRSMSTLECSPIILFAESSVTGQAPDQLNMRNCQATHIE
jgi:hypothetical protein